MKIEDILKYLANDNWDLTETNHIYKILEKDECELLLNYIANLQRKEYNNSKAIEYIKHSQNYGKEKIIYINGNDLLNILEGGNNE